jgi:hypothetical protein
MFFGKSDEVPQKINHPAQVTADGDFATFRPEQPGIFAGQTAGGRKIPKCPQCGEIESRRGLLGWKSSG